MMSSKTRGLVPILAALLLLGAIYFLPEKQKTAENVIRITARKFDYSPSRIELKIGIPVILELTALDRSHGFYVPEIGLRADVLPGQTVRVKLVPDKIGSYTFLCDIFCGDGHGEMNGVIIVTD